MHCQLGSTGVGKRCQNLRQEVNYLSERQEIFTGMVEDKTRSECRAEHKIL